MLELLEFLFLGGRVEVGTLCNLDVHLVGVKQLGIGQDLVCVLDKRRQESLCAFEDLGHHEARKVGFLGGLSEETFDHLVASGLFFFYHLL